MRFSWAKSFRWLAALLAVTLLLQACATTGRLGSQASSGPVEVPNPDQMRSMVPAVVGIPADPGSGDVYRIGPNDVLRITVFKSQDLSSEERVNEEGLISMPLIGTLEVGGLTTAEAEGLVAQRLTKLMQNPQVDVFVSDYASQRVTVMGHVKSPGIFPLKGRTTLMDAVASAGGFDPIARKREVLLFRKSSSDRVNAYVIDFKAIEMGRLTDPVVVGSDRILVPRSGAAVLGRAVGDILQGWALRIPVY